MSSCTATNNICLAISTRTKSSSFSPRHYIEVYPHLTSCMCFASSVVPAHVYEQRAALSLAFQFTPPRESESSSSGLGSPYSSSCAHVVPVHPPLMDLIISISFSAHMQNTYNKFPRIHIDVRIPSLNRMQFCSSLSRITRTYTTSKLNLSIGAGPAAHHLASVRGFRSEGMLSKAPCNWV